MTRKEERDHAFKMLYQLAVQEELPRERIEDHNSDYVKRVIDAFYAHKELIDQKIEDKLIDWRIDRILKLDLTVMRLAVIEMVYLEDIPPKVTLNEAVELAKHYSDDQSHKFVNGVLNKIMRDLGEV